eukprot:scaffold20146_cov206-Isochrysis_galbana.AAC.7
MKQSALRGAEQTICHLRKSASGRNTEWWWRCDVVVYVCIVDGLCGHTSTSVCYVCCLHAASPSGRARASPRFSLGRVHTRSIVCMQCTAGELPA